MPTLTLLGICDSSRKERMQKIISEEAEKIAFLKPETKVIELKPRNNESFRLTFNRFEACQMNYSFRTDFVLTIHTDGRILNPSAWTDDFFNYDYIGAPWNDKVVGNGGFSLRSHKLCVLANLKLLQRYNDDYAKYNGKNIKGNADRFICRTCKQQLEKLGIKFAPYDIALKFSVEHGNYNGQFGAHDKIQFNDKTYQLKNMSEEEWESLYQKTSIFSNRPEAK